MRSALTLLALGLFFAAGVVSAFLFVKWLATGRDLSGRMAGLGASLWVSFLGTVILLRLVGS
jgi:hypothetical protein